MHTRSAPEITPPYPKFTFVRQNENGRPRCPGLDKLLHKVGYEPMSDFLRIIYCPNHEQERTLLKNDF